MQITKSDVRSDFDDSGMNYVLVCDLRDGSRSAAASAGGDPVGKMNSADSTVYWEDNTTWGAADSVRSAGGQSANVDPPSMWNHASGAADWSWWSGYRDCGDSGLTKRMENLEKKMVGFVAAQNERLCADNQRFLALNERLHAENGRLCAVNERLIHRMSACADNQRFRADNERLHEQNAENGRLCAVNERLHEQNERICAVNERLHAHNERLYAENEGLCADKQRFRADNERLHAQNERLCADNERLRADKERLHAENERLHAETSTRGDIPSGVATEEKPEEELIEASLWFLDKTPVGEDELIKAQTCERKGLHRVVCTDAPVQPMKPVAKKAARPLQGSMTNSGMKKEKHDSSHANHSPDDPWRNGEAARTLQKLRKQAVESSYSSCVAAHSANKASCRALAASEKAEEAAQAAIRAEQYLLHRMDEHFASMENNLTIGVRS